MSAYVCVYFHIPPHEHIQASKSNKRKEKVIKPAATSHAINVRVVTQYMESPECDEKVSKLSKCAYYSFAF